MTQMYNYGFFIDDNHLNNFIHYLTQLYVDTPDEPSWSSISDNEISYLYAISSLTDKPALRHITTLQDLVDMMEHEAYFFDQQKVFVYELANNSLNRKINIDLKNGFPEVYTVVIKTMIDLLTNDYDVVMDKKFEMISFVRYQLERTREPITRNDYDYDFER